MSCEEQPVTYVWKTTIQQAGFVVQRPEKSSAGGYVDQNKHVLAYTHTHSVSIANEGTTCPEANLSTYSIGLYLEAKSIGQVPPGFERRFPNIIRRSDGRLVNSYRPTGPSYVLPDLKTGLWYVARIENRRYLCGAFEGERFELNPETCPWVPEGAGKDDDGSKCVVKAIRIIRTDHLARWPKFEHDGGLAGTVEQMNRPTEYLPEGTVPRYVEDKFDLLRFARNTGGRARRVNAVTLIIGDPSKAVHPYRGEILRVLPEGESTPPTMTSTLKLI